MKVSTEPRDLLGLAEAVATALDIEAFLHLQIPVTSALGVKIIGADEGHVRLRAPLEPNLNAHGTAFAGSIASLLILSGWIWLFGDLRRHKLHYLPMVRRYSVEYLKPISGTFEAVCTAPASAIGAAFRRELIDRGRARMSLQCNVFNTQSEIAASANGEYVVVA